MGSLCWAVRADMGLLCWAKRGESRSRGWAVREGSRSLDSEGGMGSLLMASLDHCAGL